MYTVTVEVALAGETAKPRARARLAKAVNNVLKVFFTMFLESSLQQDVVALSNFSRFQKFDGQNVRVAHHFRATQQKTAGSPKETSRIWISVSS